MNNKSYVGIVETQRIFDSGDIKFQCSLFKRTCEKLLLRGSIDPEIFFEKISSCKV